MRINPKINKRVKSSVSDCRETVTDAILELLEQIGVGTKYIDACFDDEILLFEHRGNTSSVMVAESIEPCRASMGNKFFFLSHDGKCVATSKSLSLSNLLIVYEAVRKMIRKY